MNDLFFEEFDEEYLRISGKWLNDPIMQALIMSDGVTEDMQQKWFRTLRQRKDYYIWGIRYETQRIGALGLKNIDYENQCSEYFGYIGEKEYWGRGIGKEMIAEAIKRAKEKGLKVLYLKVSVDNIRAIRLYEKCLFRTTRTEDGIHYMEMTL